MNKYSEAWRKKGDTLFGEEKYEEAIICYDRALALARDDGGLWYNKGCALRKLKRNKEAIWHFDRAIKLDPEDDAAWNNKGNALGSLGRHQESITCYDRAIEIYHKDVFAWDNKGLALMLLGKHKESVVCFDEALKRNPKDATVWSHKGDALNELGRYWEAIICCNKALELCPDSCLAAEIKEEAIWLLNCRIKKSKAMRNIPQYVSDDNTYEKDKLLGRAWGYSELGMHKEAVNECRKLVRLDPNDPSSFVELCFYCEESGDIEKAIKYYRYAIKRFPKCFHLYLNLGYCFEKYKKRNDLAAVCYEKALELDPNDMWALNNIGVMLAKEGKWKEAILYYEKAYEACEQSGMEAGQIMHNLAWAYYRIKSYRKAWRMFNSLIVECPDYDNGLVHSDFGCVNYKMGDYCEALKLVERGLALYPDSRQYKRLYKVVSKKVSQQL